MGGAAKAPEPPDTSRFSDEAMDQSEEMRGWAQSMWESGQQEWGKLQNWSSQVMGAALPAMEDSFSWAKEQRDRFDQYVMPQMQSLFSEAETYASKGEEDRQRGAAIQDMKAANAAQKAANERKLQSYGVDPTEMKYNALDRQAGVAEAAMSALAANQAGERTKQIGRDLRGQAINVGSQFLQDANANAQIGGQLGGSALGSAAGATATGAQISQGAMPFMQGAMSGVDLGAGIVDTAYGRQLDKAASDRAAQQQNFSQMMAVGEMAGSMMPIPGMAIGGPVMAPGGPTDDAGAIGISDGEYIVPADVVRRLGTNHFDKLIEKETGRPPPPAKQALPVKGVF